MSFAICHITSGLLYIDPAWEHYEALSEVHLEYYIHAFNHDMVPMNQFARNFRNFCEANNILPGTDLDFIIIDNYECKIIESE